MNNNLKKNPKKSAINQKKYMEKHKMICVNLDRESDKDLLNWLYSKENRSEAIRKALKEAAKNESKRTVLF